MESRQTKGKNNQPNAKIANQSKPGYEPMRILSTKKRQEAQAILEEQDTVMSNLIKDKEYAQRAYSQEK